MSDTPWTMTAADGSTGCAMCGNDLDESCYLHPVHGTAEHTPFCSRSCFLYWEWRRAAASEGSEQ